MRCDRETDDCQLAVLGYIFGNHFGPFTIDPHWLTHAVAMPTGCTTPATSPRCRFWRTHFKTPGARTPTNWPTAAVPARTSAVAGWWTWCWDRGRIGAGMDSGAAGDTAMGLFGWLFGRNTGDGSGADGSSVAQAVVVGSVVEEYAWIQEHCPGFQREMQALAEIEGRPYDIITIRNARGEERTVYFDISRFFGKR